MPVRILRVSSQEEAAEILKGVNADPCGIEAMIPKMAHLILLLGDMECEAAGIVKREMLSLGADAALSRECAGGGAGKRTEVVLMGTLKQIRRLAERLAAEPSDLSGVAEAVGGALEHFSLGAMPLRTSRREIVVGERSLIMGILNVTPDSFSDGGRFASPTAAVEEGIRLVEDGADMIDVGGESSRPGSDPVPEEEELRRVIPVIKGLAANVSVPLSVDTMKAAVARAALAAGAEIVNDISAMTHDPGMADTVARGCAAIILMHMRGTPKTMQTGDLTYRSLEGEVIGFLEEQIRAAQGKGIGVSQIMVDPGIGFGKTAQGNVRLISHLRELKVFGRPIVIGPSRKSFIGHVTGGGPQERGEGTAAAVTAAILNGSRVIRVHDVKAMKKVAAMADALARA